MSESASTNTAGFQYAPPGSFMHNLARNDELAAELHAALAREQSLLRERDELLKRQDLLAKEFDHRLLNSLQMIASLLSLQSRTATPEAAAQLNAAARRVAAFGRVHHRLHLLDHQEHVEFRLYLEQLCEDISGLLFEDQAGPSIVVDGVDLEIPTVLAIPLGFIVNELITNSAKYAAGVTTVRIEKTSLDSHSVSVFDDGPGLPTGFDPTDSKGLGMKIVRSLVDQIGGELHISPGGDGRGASFTVGFCATRPQHK
ncbi:sensor histidine kinase [Xanthobacteraceae bacterium Astr-EGSB]|uniref:sensor histidine kinase n=1 Tax=Astrobacterium formosum TaxID=3069710 RepID=UPI0027AEA291|nr:sensor histidine kinase [Xanthobacteraceae bacterium Astr-EGSB]